MFLLSIISVIGSFRRFKQKSGHLNRNSAVKLPPMSSSRAPASCSVVTEQQHRIGSSLRFYLELRDPVSQDPSTNRRYRQFAQDHLELTADKQMQSAHSMSSLYCGFLYCAKEKGRMRKAHTALNSNSHFFSSESTKATTSETFFNSCALSSGTVVWYSSSMDIKS